MIEGLNDRLVRVACGARAGMGGRQQQQAAGNSAGPSGARNSKTEYKTYHGVLRGRAWLCNAFGALVACLRWLST